MKKYFNRPKIKIDDRDVPRAKNDIEFIMDPEFMDIALYPKQLMIAINLLGTNCPFCSDMKYINNVKVDGSTGNMIDRSVFWDSNGICPKCKQSRWDAIHKNKMDNNNQFVGVVGQRGGKSALTVILAATITYKRLLLPNASEIVPGILKNDTLHGTFVSLTFGQVFQNLWQPFYGLLTETKWFKEYVDFLTTEGERLGKELVRIRDTFAIFHHKNIALEPSGPDKRKLRGATRFLTSIDELSHFFGEGIKYDPDEIYKALNNSLTTVRAGTRKVLQRYPYLPSAYGIYISSPRTKTDKAMRMFHQSKASNTIYGLNCSTWEFNPNITREDLADEFRDDPVGAERDYGANPPHSSSPFISSPASIIPCFSKTKNLFLAKGYKITKDSLGGNLLSPNPLKLKNTHTYPSVVSVDCGYSYNSFAIVLQRWKDKFNDIVQVDGIIEFIPDPYPLDYIAIYDNVISVILENFNVKMIVCDRWNSINILQKSFQKYKVDGLQYTIKYKEFDKIRSKCVSNEYSFPKPEHEIKEIIDLKTPLENFVVNAPVSHLFLQLLSVHDTGRTITKGDEGTDDIHRALSIGTSMLYHKEYAIKFTDEGDLKNNTLSTDNIMVVINKSMPNVNQQINESNIGVVLSGSQPMLV